MAGNIINKLCRLNFPDCTKEALAFLTSFISQDPSAIPGFNSNTEQMIVEICQEFVLFKSVHGPQKTLTAMQELHLLDMICSCFSKAPEKSKYRIFNLMFGARGDSSVNLLLTKLVSLALSVRCAPVLFCAAIWIQERDCLSPDVKALTERLVNDYCLLYPDPSNVFSSLPRISPLFTCNFITSATSFYSFADADSLPPYALVQHVSEWVYQDNMVCCESLRQAEIHSAYTTPIPGLTGWCVRGPLVCCRLREKRQEGSILTESYINSLLTSLDKLHLALLQSLDFTAAINLPLGLISASDLAHIAQTIEISPKPSQEEQKACHVALERLAQILQVASNTRTYMEDSAKLKEMETLAGHKLPHNRGFFISKAANTISSETKENGEDDGSFRNTVLSVLRETELLINN